MKAPAGPAVDRAAELDRQDPLSGYRRRFHLPPGPGGEASRYFCGNSLGLQPRSVPERMRQELDDWANLAVDAHFHGSTPWYSYHEVFQETMASLVGAEPGEVVIMNSLTANLHLMLTSFYRPRGDRRKILVEDAAFPSDTYAVKSHLGLHGLSPEDDLIVATPRPGEACLRTADLEDLLARRGAEIALVMLPGVQYYTGQLFDMARITAAGRAQGCTVGFDLAHAAGNVPLQLHEWGVDFAVWCTYKYLNAGPGAVGGCFVHSRHETENDLPRLAGWWGNDPESRFRMHLIPEFVPVPGAAGWQLSNPPILAMAPLRASLDLFREAGGMEALRAKSLLLTGFFEERIKALDHPEVTILTPSDPSLRGAQLSIRIRNHSEQVFRSLVDQGIIVDYRRPDVIRAAPVPLYNSFCDVLHLCSALGHCLGNVR